MTFAFGHLFGAWITGKTYEFRKGKISQWTWIFLLFGSLLPDTDYLLDWTLGTTLHRTFTHSLLFVIVVSLIIFVLFRKKSYSLALGAGVVTHLVLDSLLFPGIPLLWPSLQYISIQGVHLLDPATFTVAMKTIEQLKFLLYLAILDMGIGTAWIFYLLVQRKIRL